MACRARVVELRRKRKILMKKNIVSTVVRDDAWLLRPERVT